MTFPIGLLLNGRKCLVVGHGDAASSRARRLAKGGALVHWLCEGEPARVEAVGPGSLDVHGAEFSERHLDGVWLAVSTDRDDALASRMQAACELRRIWYCAIDQPDRSSFAHLAILDIDPILITVSSGGQAPLLSRTVRDELARVLGAPAVREFFRRIAALRASTPKERRLEALKVALNGFRIKASVELPDHSNSGTTSKGSGAG
jgi:uroporphyrin-III C-methyltransferase/precorrin-2 dehydrogenase/sirohydrochlorin ferrochelatase